MRFTGEHEFTPSVTMRMGLGFFYGWVREDFVFAYSNAAPSGYTDDISSDGYHWGIGGSVGGTFTFNNFTLEGAMKHFYSPFGRRGGNILFREVYIRLDGGEEPQDLLP